MLSAQEAAAAAAAHAARVEGWTREHLARRSHGDSHPVWDFLFDYYSLKPAQLARWHPGVGTAIAGEDLRAAWRDYHVTTAACEGGRPGEPVTAVDVAGLWARRGASFEFIADLFAATESNPAHFDCFGLHEWAMVYRTDTPRHSLPLRLGAVGTNAVVDSHQVRCTHFDAFRFFTPAARPHNARQLTRDDQISCEQSGCLHATMDLLKWALKLGPLVPGEVLLDAFALARDARRLDMEASPYDCRGLGFGVVPIETPEGKAEYVRRQRALAAEGSRLRARLSAVVAEARSRAGR
ncbi:3-methyladenine DNA glycosylase [Corynebacterium sp. 13CS0277]|nr:3-methyladenine DNA glycosylase [Corynebacterium sp. 13CS0277]